MTDEEIAAIKARAEAAAPGPWELRNGDMQTLIAADPPGYRVTRMLATPEDAAFITHAREDIPTLLAEVEAWREIGRQLIGLDDTGLRYYPSEIDKVVDQARALLGHAS